MESQKADTGTLLNEVLNCMFGGDNKTIYRKVKIFLIELHLIGNKKISNCVCDIMMASARTYCGAYSRQTIEALLSPLFAENKIAWPYFFELFRKAQSKYDRLVIVNVDDSKSKVIITPSLVNAILIALEKMGKLTFELYQSRCVYWVCQEEENGSFCSSLYIFPSQYLFKKQLFFLDEEEARNFFEAFCKERDINGGEYVYLKTTAEGMTVDIEMS